MKENNFYFLYCTSPDINYPAPNQYETVDTYYKEYERYVKNLRKEVKEVCPDCKHIFDEIFEFRKQNLSKLSLKLLGMYDLPTWEDKNKKKKNNQDTV